MGERGRKGGEEEGTEERRKVKGKERGKEEVGKRREEEGKNKNR